VIIHKIYVASIAVFKTKYHASVPADDHRPETYAITGHGMQAKAWRLHIRRLSPSVEPRQHTFQLVHDISAYPAAIAALEKTLQSAMPEISYHPMYLYCKLTLVTCRVKNDSEKLRTDPPWTHKLSPAPA